MYLLSTTGPAGFRFIGELIRSIFELLQGRFADLQSSDFSQPNGVLEGHR
jgi:hypothetical protein